MHDKIINSLMSSPTIGIVITDTEGCIQQANPAYCTLTGYDEADLKELRVTDLFHSNDREREAQTLRTLLESDESHFYARKRYLGKAGKVFWGDTHLSVINAPDGSCEAMLSMVSDATEMRRQEILQQGQSRILEQLYQDHSLEDICASIVATIETLEEGLFCSILKLNETTLTLHKLAAPSLPGFYNDAIEGMKIGTDIGSCGAAAFHKQRVIVEEILGHPNWKRARRLIEKTTLRSCWSQPIFSHEGKVLGTFAMYYETPRKPSPSELELISAAADMTALAISHKQAITALTQSNDLKSEFISTAAHELSTPLTAIMGFTDILLDPVSSNNFSKEEKRGFLLGVMEKSETLNRMIKDFLDLSRIESGLPLPLERKATDITAVLRKLVGLHQLQSKGHTLTLKLPEDTVNPLLNLDQHRICQVFENLFSNAVKYSPAGTDIHIVGEEGAEAWSIRIQDQGIGMNREQVEKVFDKFYRANDTDSQVKGLGLGMSIVKQIVDTHGGSIQVESREGEGTTVSLQLPFSGQSQPSNRDGLTG